MPTILKIDGYRFFFFSNEGTEPVHVHVESAGRYAKFWLQPVALVSSVGYNGKELTRLRKIIEERSELFVEKWNEHFSTR
jgi:hypothetical protein